SITMKLKLPALIACIIAGAVPVTSTCISITNQVPFYNIHSSTIAVINQTPDDIHVRVTTTAAGDEKFYALSPEGAQEWLRTDWQVAFILRDDNNATETLVVKPGNTYTIA
ncbi:hypothetical protein BGZ46_009052, partial [Entomortierella lignicola]